MRRILVAAAIAAAACGSKPTIMATPEIKATASQAQLGMSSASTNTQASIGLQSIGSSLGDAAASGSVSTVDLTTGLPDPAQMAALIDSAVVELRNLMGGEHPPNHHEPVGVITRDLSRVNGSRHNARRNAWSNRGGHRLSFTSGNSPSRAHR